jgi:hypothetical protein
MGIRLICGILSFAGPINEPGAAIGEGGAVKKNFLKSLFFLLVFFAF